jgi:hypothetical protein
MGQGAIKYHGQVMMNCRESFLSNIGDSLLRVAKQPPFDRFRGLAESWVREVSEMPPGCSMIHLDEHLPDQEAVESFTRALHATLREIGDEKPGTREVVQQLMVFLLDGYERLAPVYRGKKAEPDAAGNSRPAEQSSAL